MTPFWRKENMKKIHIESLSSGVRRHKIAYIFTVHKWRNIGCKVIQSYSRSFDATESLNVESMLSTLFPFQIQKIQPPICNYSDNNEVRFHQFQDNQIKCRQNATRTNSNQSIDTSNEAEKYSTRLRNL